jgi:hypothetical protein
MNDSRSSFKARALLVMAMTIAAAIGVTNIVRRPDLNCNEGYVLGEAGNQLWRAERLGQGAMLYRDVACQYGYLPPYAYMLFTRIAGNTILANNIWHVVGSVVCVGLLFELLRREVPLSLACVGTVLVSFQLLLAPGGIIGRYTIFEHLSMERACLLAVMLLWRAPTNRSKGHALALGSALGVWQGVKFGGAFFAGAGVLALDFLAILKQPQPRALWVPWIKNSVFVLAGFVVVASIWVVLALATLPLPIAEDTIWPAYLADVYKEARLHGPIDWNIFLRYKLAFPACGVLGLLGLGMWFFSHSQAHASQPASFEPPASFLGLLFYFVGFSTFLGTIYLRFQYAWAMAPAAVWTLASLRPLPRIAATLAFMPGFVLMLQMTFTFPADPEYVPYTLPNGERIVALTPQIGTLDRLSQLADHVPRSPGREFMVFSFYYSGGGFHHYYDRPYPLRNYLVYADIFRPYDVSELTERFDQVGALVVFKGLAPVDELYAELTRFLSPMLVDRVQEQFELDLRYSGKDFVVFTRRRTGT